MPSEVPPMARHQRAALRRSLVAILIVIPGAVLIVSGVLGSNRQAARMMGYDGMIDAPRIVTAESGP